MRVTFFLNLGAGPWLRDTSTTVAIIITYTILFLFGGEGGGVLIINFV